MTFDESNDLSSKNVSRDIGIEENMENLELTKESEESQEGIFEKAFQLEVVLPQLE